MKLVECWVKDHLEMSSKEPVCPIHERFVSLFQKDLVLFSNLKFIKSYIEVHYWNHVTSAQIINCNPFSQKKKSFFLSLGEQVAFKYVTKTEHMENIRLVSRLPSFSYSQSIQSH